MLRGLNLFDLGLVFEDLQKIESLESFGASSVFAFKHQKD